MTTACPTPTKSRYATGEAAESAARRVALRLDTLLTPYECPCTWWHLTKDQRRPMPDPANVTPADVERVGALPDAEFRAIVLRDSTAKGEPTDRAALRHRLNLKRWQQVLGELNSDINQQFAGRRLDRSPEANEWRRRARGYRDSLVVRTAECKRLRVAAHVERMGEQSVAALRGEEVAAEEQTLQDALTAETASPKELRGIAGERAMDRLMAAHRADWTRFLIEEFTALGLEVPERVLRHAPSEEEAA